jgi:hypothetical protein
MCNMKYDVIRSYWPAPIYSDGSTLNLDFTTGTLDSRLTFTRASTVATYINSSGYVTTASTNVPRFDYDPATLAPRGLLIESQAINILLYSAETSNAYWQKYLCTISGTLASAPDNTTSARLVIEDSGSVEPSLQKTSNTVDVSSAYTFSVWFKAPTSNAASLMFDSQTGTISGAATAYGTITAASGSVVSYSGSWYRASLTFTIPASGITQIACKFQLSGTGTRTGDGSASAYTGDGVSGMYVWGTQLEKGSGASSYIPSAASQVTRNADNCVMTGTNFSSWYTQGIGTVSWSGSAFRTTAGHLANINTVNNDPRITAYIGTGSLTNLVTNGTTQASMFFGTVTANTAFKAAWRFNTNDFAGCLNAGTVYTDTVGTVPTGVDRIQFGAAEGGYQFLDGWIKSFKYYPTAFTDAQLQAITTL